MRYDLGRRNKKMSLARYTEKLLPSLALSHSRSLSLSVSSSLSPEHELFLCSPFCYRPRRRNRIFFVSWRWRWLDPAQKKYLQLKWLMTLLTPLELSQSMPNSRAFHKTNISLKPSPWLRDLEDKMTYFYNLHLVIDLLHGSTFPWAFSSCTWANLLICNSLQILASSQLQYFLKLVSSKHLNLYPSWYNLKTSLPLLLSTS